MTNEFKIVSKEIVYDGFFKMLKYRVKHSLFGGGVCKPYTRELLERGHAVAVLLHDPDRDEIVLVEQFRIGAIESDNPWVIELAAGMVEHGESSEEVARREVEEECGAKIGDLQFVADFYSSVGGSSETTALYYSVVDANKFDGVHGLGSENEDIRVVKMSSDEFVEKVTSNAFRSASLVTAGYWFIATQVKV
ncbi:MAG: ADP-ribose diphosphatase [Alteromonadaceae bacterium]|nr:MAG: ADP-ribose diphosphatase [Alteromonadaceae bacterium]